MTVIPHESTEIFENQDWSFPCEADENQNHDPATHILIINLCGCHQYLCEDCINHVRKTLEYLTQFERGSYAVRLSCKKCGTSIEIDPADIKNEYTIRPVWN